VADIQQQQQQQQPEVVGEFQSRVMCPTTDGICSCDVDKDEHWTVSVDGCLTCACVTRSITSHDNRPNRAEYTTSQSTTTVADWETTTQTSISATSMTMTWTSQQEVTLTGSTVTTSSQINVECRQLSDGDCADVTCDDLGYAKDENGCDVCSCAIAVKEKEPAKTVHHVVATARKGAMMMKLPIILVCAKNLKTSLVYRTKPRAKTTEQKCIDTENGPISQGSQSGVSVVRDLFWKGFTKRSFEIRVKK